MSREGTSLKIMGCAAGMLIAAVIVEQIAPKFSNPYLVLFIGLAIGAVVGYILTSLLRSFIVKKKNGKQ